VQAAEGQRVSRPRGGVPRRGESVEAELRQVGGEARFGHGLGEAADGLSAGAAQDGVAAREAALDQPHGRLLHVLRAQPAAALGLGHSLQTSQNLKF